MEERLNNIRNFCIVAHVDHGKSTLADRFLEITGAVSAGKMKEQFLDSMDLEREKGITIKMHPVRLVWRPFENLEIENSLKIENWKLKIKGSEFILNLIDTPGHIDFTYEISRALACCEAALLLVDANKGVQAQTLFNLEQAQKQGLKIFGIVNKVDAASREQIDETKKELSVILNQPESEILEVSGKTGFNAQLVLEKVASEAPAPKAPSHSASPLKALVFDSKYDAFAGVVAYIRVFEGEVKRGDKVLFYATGAKTDVKELGYFTPALQPCETLRAGEIGYIKTGIKTPALVKVGDTLTISNLACPAWRQTGRQTGFQFPISNFPLPGYKEPQPVLYLSLYPELADQFEMLKDGLNKLRLSDPSLDFEIESKMALGRGFRVGFLGNLHAEITIRRLKADFNLDLVATSPQVIFQVKLKNNKEVSVSSPSFWPDPGQIEQSQEPFVEIEVVAPNSFYGPVFKCLQTFDGELQDTKPITSQKSLFVAHAPLREIISGAFYEMLKSQTQGYGSFSFKPIGMRPTNLVKVDILIAGVKEEPFAKIVPERKAFDESKKFLLKLKDVLPHQQFALALQAAISGKVIARETISAFRKDVTAPLYGGDITRKRKLLEKQKKGKKDLKTKARVIVPAQTFLDILKP